MDPNQSLQIVTCTTNFASGGSHEDEQQGNLDGSGKPPPE